MARIVVQLNIVDRGETHDIDVPTDINARELLEGLNEAYGLRLPSAYLEHCFVKVDNPLVLMHGKRTLGEYGLMSGSIINVESGDRS